MFAQGCKLAGCTPENTYRSHGLLPQWIGSPFQRSDQHDYCDPNLEEREPLAQTCPPSAMKRDELGSAVRLAIPGIDVLDGAAPSLWPELVRILAPRLSVSPSRVGIVSDIRAGWNRDLAAEADIRRCPTVQELRNGREQTKAFVDDRGQIWQIVGLGKC